MGHSLSPAIHNAAFAALGLPWKYLLLPTPPSALKRVVERLKGGRWAGANVTIPHKEAIIPYLDHLSPQAEAIGAVNTIVVQEGKCMGHNTDATGFIHALGQQGFEPRDKRALVLGAGGAACAVTYALLQAGAEVVVSNRTLERAEALALSFTKLLGPFPLAVRPLTKSVLGEEIERCQLLINTTSLGMAPQSQLSPWPEEVSIPAGIVVFDLVYAPLETRLLQQAKAAGAQTIGGLQMLIEQGVEAFRLWTGLLPPREVIYQAALAAVSTEDNQEERCCAS